MIDVTRSQEVLDGFVNEYGWVPRRERPRDPEFSVTATELFKALDVIDYLLREITKQNKADVVVVTGTKAGTKSTTLNPDG